MTIESTTSGVFNGDKPAEATGSPESTGQGQGPSQGSSDDNASHEGFAGPTGRDITNSVLGNDSSDSKGEVRESGDSKESGESKQSGAQTEST